MQVLVMYYSKTGNTKKLAEHVAKGVREIDEVDCLLKPVSEVTKDDFVKSDGIIAGSPVYFGAMVAEMKQIFDDFVSIRQRMGDKIGAAFTTSGDPTGGKETTIFSIFQAMLIYGMIIVGDPLDATGHYGVACVGAPDEQTAANGVKLGRRVALLVKKLRG
ncbi:MAG: NAD(P)H-dependent oxidoreductase [Candidatus Zixiibacteriota bacterium]|nr:MAG: NAD(P)H-dependent oxidoreductase [candidate division Zixibacteria bacterium]